MRIAQIAPLYEDVPPTAYGGTERVIAGLCNGLVRAGHDVTLFATRTSRTAARLVPVVDRPLRAHMDAGELLTIAPHLHLRMLHQVQRQAADFDVIHSHVDLLSLPFTGSTIPPWVITLHGRLDIPEVQQLLPLYPWAPFVSISNDQRRALDGVPVDWLATVPNGLDLDRYHRAPRGPSDHLVFVGRISPEKRPDLAIEVARRTGWPLRIGAKVDPMDVDYFEREIEPLFEHESMEFVGELSEREKPAFYAHAAATLFPSDWPEPFGLVMIESLAAGTPVIALRRGSVPEILEHGVSGFICDDVDDMVEAVRHVDDIDPADCRRRARDFGVEQMCRRYERVYETLLSPRSFAYEAALPSFLGINGRPHPAAQHLHRCAEP